MMERRICPALLAEGHEGYSPLAIKYLFRGRKAVPQLAFYPTGAPEEELAHVGRTIYYAVAKKGRMRLIRKKEVGRLRLEFLPQDASREAAERRMVNRHLTMQLADQVYKICTQKSGIAFAPDGSLVLVLRREQVDDNYCVHKLLTLRQLLGDEQPDTLAAACSVMQTAAGPLALTLEQFLEQLIFNYLYGNDNTTLADYALMEFESGDMQMAPAFHLENVALYNGQPQTGTLGEELRTLIAQHATACDAFRQLGQQWGLPSMRLERVLKRFMTLPALVDRLIDNSFLCPEDKMAYKLLVTSRYRQYTGAPVPKEAEPVVEPVAVAESAPAVAAEPAPMLDLFGNPVQVEAPKSKKKGKDADDEPAVVYGSLF